jgi:hypothetical protein
MLAGQFSRGQKDPFETEVGSHHSSAQNTPKALHYLTSSTTFSVHSDAVILFLQHGRYSSASKPFPYLLVVPGMFFLPDMYITQLLCLIFLRQSHQVAQAGLQLPK